jgi:hypothetical protein
MKTIAAGIGFALVALTSPAHAEGDWATAAIRKLKEAPGANTPASRLGGPVTNESSVSGRRTRSAARGTRVASLGSAEAPSVSSSSERSSRAPSYARRSLSGGSINWVASSGCLNSSLRSVIAGVASNFGAVRVNSTCRGRGHNARVGGARKSYHLTGNAADFRVFGSVGAVYAYLRSNGNVGGLKHYGGGLFHIDTGPRRSW